MKTMDNKKTILLSFFLLVSLTFCFSSSAKANSDDATIKISSKSFTSGGTIPKDYTADGKDISPELSWSSPPKGTKSFALTCEDPDAPAGTWFHWIVFNIPADTQNLKSNMSKKPKLKNGVIQGSNDFRKSGYNGPSPPKGPAHHYNFKLFALDSKLKLKPGCTKQQFYKAIKDKVLGQGVVTGIYQRK